VGPIRTDMLLGKRGKTMRGKYLQVRIHLMGQGPEKRRESVRS
jgi:hypothetical protein